MEYTVFIQPHQGGGFIASVPGLPGCPGLGRTKADALQNIRANIKDFLSKTTVTRIKVDDNRALSEDPWEEVIGMFAEDETFDDFQKEIKKYRRRVKSLACG